jgi:competence protein ComEC
MIASLFLSANLGFITGVALASFNIPKYILLITLLRFKKFKLILIFIVFALLGAWRYGAYQVQAPKIDLTSHNGSKVVLLGKVAEEIDPGGDYQKITIKALKVNNRNTNGLVLVTLNKFPELKYGDVLELTGNLEAPDNWSAFRYDRYLARYDIYSLMAWPKVKVVGHTLDFYSRMLDVKNKVYRTINSALPEPEAGLANALLLGYKNTLDAVEKKSFSCCGLSHVVAISGSHLTLLSALAFNFLLALGLSSRSAFKPVVVFIWFYTILTGLQTSALRSAIMISLVLWGKKNGRGDAGGRILFITAAIMLFFNPFLLRDDLGFQLSFLAMIALIYFCPLGEKIFGQGNIKSVLIMTIASQLVTWPIAAYNFGTFSLIAPLANLLIVWLFAWLLPALLAASAISLVIPAFKVLWFAPSYFMLSYTIKTSNLLAAWPKACFNWQITWQFVLIYYLILVIIYLLTRFIIDKIHKK